MKKALAVLMVLAAAGEVRADSTCEKPEYAARACFVDYPFGCYVWEGLYADCYGFSEYSLLLSRTMSGDVLVKLRPEICSADTWGCAAFKNYMTVRVRCDNDEIVCSTRMVW